ncbi:MAG TPA: hypothetical protein ENI34_04890 [candidate division WOR-3 bacterium]|uniref:Pyrrolo-quinoline quinone repeat domain-containing protein n=1 Tax=candidate division WOR-3 bacterium TaxID=2052148 RepID=A0A9C9ELY9_UNCW3|nr:hypothetical protein [candidate division WOR-3 bacterium]
MKTIIYFTIILLCFMLFAFAQAPDTLWTRTYGGPANDMGYSVQELNDGGFIIAGWTQSYGAGGQDVYLVKTDASGNVQWEKTYGGQYEEMGWSVIPTIDGGYMIAGYTYSFGNGNGDMYLIRTDSLGDTLWTRTYGGDSTDLAFSLIAASDKEFVLAGQTCTWGAGYNDVYIVKVDSMGNLIWQKTYGGPARESAYSIQPTYDGGYLIAGYTTSFGSGGEDAYVIRTDSNGDSLWTHTYGHSGHDLISKAETTSDSGYVLIGYTESYGASYGDYFLVRANRNGDTLWVRNYGGELSEWGYVIKETADGNYVLVGWSDSYYPPNGSNIYFMKINQGGDTLWTKLYGGDNNDAAFDMQITSDGGYIIVGSTESYGAGGEDIYLIKTAPDTFGIKEKQRKALSSHSCATIFSGSLRLPEGEDCKVFDITGRMVMPDKIKPGIYFIEVNGQITKKVVKVR